MTTDGESTPMIGDVLPPGGAPPADEDMASVLSLLRREDLAAICGRLDAAPTFAVVLNAPAGNRALSTELGIRRLLRHVEETGRLVAIATSSLTLANRARQAGIPVARKPQYIRWDANGRRVVRLLGHSFLAPALGRYLQVVVILAIGAAFAGAALTVAPSATVVAIPPTEELSRRVTITADPSRDDIDFDTLAVPAQDVTLTTRVTLATRTTGKILVGTVPAVVTLTIRNSGQNAVAVPAGAVAIASNRVGFETNADLQVAPGATGTVAATARVLGGDGNLPASSITAWAEPARFPTLTVTNAGISTGGFSAERPAVDVNDIATLRRLAESLRDSESVRARAAASRPRDAVFLSTARAAVVLGEPSLPPGAPGDILLVDVDVTVTALAVVSSTLDRIARHVLSDGAAERGEFIAGTVTARETGARQATADSAAVRTELEVRGLFARDIRRGDLKAAVKGKSASEARSTLAERYGIQDADVRLSPGWAPWLPRFAFRIDVELRGPDSAAPGASATTTTDDTPGSPTGISTPAARP